MLGKFFGAALAAGLVLAASSANASCEVGGKEVPCEVKGGHYRIKVPDGPGPYPAVVYLYGSSGNSRELMSYDGFVQAFLQRGYAVIVPAALNIRYRDGVDSGWHLRNERGGARDDTAFVARVLEDAKIRHRIKRDRVLIAGMSRGGFLAWDIACHNPRLARAYAPVAGGYLGRVPKRCSGPARVLHTHGRSDRIVPVEASWSSGGARMADINESLSSVAAANGCVAPEKARRYREYDRIDWKGCPRGTSVGLLMHDGGHTIPLSWYSTVIDWFENDALPNETERTYSSRAAFKGAGSGNSRFKKARTSSD